MIYFVSNEKLIFLFNYFFVVVHQWKPVIEETLHKPQYIPMISRPSHKLFLSNFSLTCFNTLFHKEIFKVRINFEHEKCM